MVELRNYLRTSSEYRVEYGPFPLSGRDGELKTSVIKNIGAGGLMFQAPESYPPGRQLVLKIYLTGWRREGDEIVETDVEGAEALITAVAEVKRADPNAEAGCYDIGVQFLGRIMD